MYVTWADRLACLIICGNCFCIVLTHASIDTGICGVIERSLQILSGCLRWSQFSSHWFLSSCRLFLGVNETLLVFVRLVFNRIPLCPSNVFEAFFHSFWSSEGATLSNRILLKALTPILLLVLYI